MKDKILLRLLGSIPIILIFLYFIPFLGICLILFRYFICDYKKRNISFFLIMIGFIILLPSGLNGIFKIIKFDSTTMPYFYDIISSELYSINLIKYGKFLLTIGIIFLIITFTFNRLFVKVKNFIYSYIHEQEKRDAEISQKNDLIMKEKQEKAKNTRVVYCPYCGADNILISKNGTCKYCRRQI